jgi:uncharacterized protein (TIGR00730 family)
MKSVLVFCGSSAGLNECYVNAAAVLGATLARQCARIIYGGAKVGLMGTVANAALDNGGEVVGVIPDFLKTKEVAHESLTELITVGTMHERKLKMFELSDSMIALPGGWGTMEEMFEMLTWGQLGLHNKPIGLLNINGYYDPLEALCKTMVKEGFLPAETSEILITDRSMENLLEKMKAYQPPPRPKWISKERT